MSSTRFTYGFEIFPVPGKPDEREVVLIRMGPNRSGSGSPLGVGIADGDARVRNPSPTEAPVLARVAVDALNSGEAEWPSNASGICFSPDRLRA